MTFEKRMQIRPYLHTSTFTPLRIHWMLRRKVGEDRDGNRIKHSFITTLIIVPFSISDHMTYISFVPTLVQDPHPCPFCIIIIHQIRDA